jgi:hypothetical protein
VTGIEKFAFDQKEKAARQARPSFLVLANLASAGWRNPA